MILFKRVGESLRHIEDREWALLIMETLGVLAGILIAFALQEWASRRSAAAKHHEMMERLFEESEQDVATLRDTRDFMRGLRDTEVQFATELSNGQCPPEPLWTAVQSVAMMPSFLVPRSVYEELMGAGGLSSISDPKVRGAIATFNAQLAWAEGQNDYFRSTPPLAAPPADKRVHYHFHMKSAEPLVVTFDRASLCADSAFRNETNQSVREHFVLVMYHEGMTNLAIDMCALLGGSLGQQCRPSAGGLLKGEDEARAKRALSTT